MKIKKIFLVLSVCVSVCLCVNNSAYAQSMKLVIGQYECTSNSSCNNGYCDIDSHKCVNIDTYCNELGYCSCSENDDNTSANSCLTVSDCQSGWSVVNNVCKECVSDTDCTGNKPRCVSNQCVSCPTNRPVWNGEYCDCVDGEINVDGTCVKCISSNDCPNEKPVCNAISHRCEACPSDKPNWNGEYCDCPDGEYFADGKCMKLVECFTNANCMYLKPVCNTVTGLCEQCPASSPYWDGLKCVSTCPTSKPKANTTTRLCEECPAGTPYWEGTACVATCPTNKPKANTTTKWCEACPSSTPYWAGTSCVSTCPASKPKLNTTTKWCEACSSWTPYWDGSSCVASCPTNKPKLNTATKSCEACPGGTPYWDGSSCVASCPTSKPILNASTKFCEPCPDGGEWNASRNKCVINFVVPTVETWDYGSMACLPVVPKFGPYTRNYTVYVNGTTDDAIRFYIGNTNMPQTQKPQGCAYNKFDGTYVSAGGEGLKNMGTLAAGQIGSLVVVNNQTRMLFGRPGTVWLELQ